MQGQVLEAIYRQTVILIKNLIANFDKQGVDL